MNCTNCGGETIVTRTVDSPDKPSRTRLCLSCGKVGVTVEVWGEVEGPQAFQKVLEGILAGDPRAEAKAVIARWREEKWGSGCRSRSASSES